MDAKSSARLSALMRWAEAAADLGHDVPDANDLELIAVAKSAAHPDVDATTVEPWAATIAWIIAQASMGVADPYGQLPDELRSPSTVDALEPDRESVPALVEPEARAARARARTPRWEDAARQQAVDAVRRFEAPLKELLERDANEGDTRLLVTDMLCEGLGYDKFADLTTEYMVRQDFADFGVRIDKQLVAFIEVKRISQKLNERHLRQIQMYAVNEGIEWMILTNGRHWEVYHLTGGLPVVIDLVFVVDLLGPEAAEEKAALLYYLHHDSLKRRQIENVWKHSAATSPGVVLESLLSDGVLDVLRRDIKRKTGTGTDLDTLREVLRGELINPKALSRWDTGN